MRSTALIVFVTVLTAACGGDRQGDARRFAASGDAFTASGDWSAAEIEYRNAVQRWPEWAEVHRKLASIYVETGRPDDAYREFSRAVALDPANTQAHLEFGRLFLASGSYDDARFQARSVLDREPQNVEAQILLGNALANLHQIDDALTALESAASIDSSGRAYTDLGEVKTSTGDTTGAEQAFRAAIQSAPKSADARVAFAYFLTTQKRPGEAERQLQDACALSPESELANRAMAAFYLSAGRIKEGEASLERAARAPHQQYRSSLALADYYIRARRYDEAQRTLDGIETTSRDYAGARVRLAAIAFDTGKKDEGRKLLDAALKSKKNPDALLLQAHILAGDGHSDEALSAARQALGLDPSLVAARFLIGSI